MSRPRLAPLLLAATVTAGGTLLPLARAGATLPAWQRAKAAALAHFSPPPPAGVSLGAPAPSGAYVTQSVAATVAVGPGRATTCSVVGELLTPVGVGPGSPAPAVMVTNGFGGSYDDGTTLPIAQDAATNGFVALSYSGLGFGGSGCQIELDSPAWDGLAASELISWLGALPQVTRDGADDPRVGMVGGSYGGGVQFSTAAIDPRLDAIVPVITWNDLAYSLAPDNDPADAADTEPGVLKWEWASFFFGDGAASGAQYENPSTATTCPDFDPAVCQAFVSSVALGYPDPATVALLRADSMVDFWRQLHLPVLLAQGEQDSLFDLHEAVANYQELRTDGDPVQLVIQSWGHDQLTPAPGEFSTAAPFQAYENILVTDFLAHWLKGQDVSTGAPVQYFRPWVAYTGNAAPAYGSAPAWPVGSPRRYTLSGASDLVTGGAVAGQATFANPPGGIGTSYSGVSAVGGDVPPVAPTDPPGTASGFESAPLTAALDVVGVPSVTVRLGATVPAGLSPTTDPVVVAKLYDLAPDGTATLADRLVAPSRLGQDATPVTLDLPGIVHRFAAGDRLELVLAAGDTAYLGNRAADVYTVQTGPGSVLSLPAVAPSAEQSGGPPPAGD